MDQRQTIGETMDLPPCRCSIRRLCVYSRLGYQIKMIDNNGLDDVDSLAGNSSSLALSVIKSKSHPKLIPSFSGHDSLSKIISTSYHWVTQGIRSWPGRISLHTPTLPITISTGSGILKMCLTVRVTMLLDTRVPGTDTGMPGEIGVLQKCIISRNIFQ